MNTPELRRLKMEWLAAKEAGDTQTQKNLLQQYPDAQDALIDFIAAYHATGGDDVITDDEPLLPITQRAYQAALERVFPAQSELAFANLTELRKSHNMSKVEAARGLRLGIDVWNKFESGAIELVSLSQRQLAHLAQFFSITLDQFNSLLDASQPTVTLNRRQSANAARQSQQGPQKQSFTEAINRSTMSTEDKHFWLDE
ncbi:MAG TPA: helix-turn-helix transcriptional regulator [Dictyobacter sp.]|jgi:transcriptional regulator with XRE-family HTH domain|nr:helix-turn-helix transcriptional regulator [Dictyobacter sp.]